MSNCSNSISGDKPKLKQQKPTNRLKMSGELPSIITAGNHFESVIHIISGRVVTATIKDRPGWIHTNVSNKGKILTIYGKSPNKKGFYHINLSLKNGRGGGFGFSFRMTIVDGNRESIVNKQESPQSTTKSNSN